MNAIDPVSRRQQTILERRELPYGVGVGLRAVLHHRGHEIHLRHQLLLDGVDARNVPME
jgi:hypothetical protein